MLHESRRENETEASYKPKLPRSEWGNRIKWEPSRALQREELNWHAAKLWNTLIKGDMAKKNVVYYHSCCLSFSKAKFAKHSCHPAEFTKTLGSLKAEHRIYSLEAFQQFLLKAIQNAPKYAQYFPRINYVHQSGLDIKEVVEWSRTDHANLGKRELNLMEDNFRLLRKNEELEQINGQYAEEIKRLHTKVNRLEFQVGISNLKPKKIGLDKSPEHPSFTEATIKNKCHQKSQAGLKKFTC